MDDTCTWPVVYVDCTPADGETARETIARELAIDPTVFDRAEEMAKAYLQNLTGYGTCTTTLRPCRDTSRYGGAPWQPALVGGAWYNLTCGVCTGGCRCAPDTATSISLPGVVDSVTEVVVDGTPLPADAYRVDNRHYLVRTDGGTWPFEQDVNSAPTEPGTWAVTYERGRGVPVGGQVAAGELAVEFAKALCDDNSCRLPKRIQSVTRQGVSVTVLDSFEDLEKGHTGIWLIDSWVASVTNVQQRATVHSPDLPGPRHRRTTWQRA